MEAQKFGMILITTAAIGFADAAPAETCYDVAGSSSSRNVTESVQIGRISLTLSQGGTTAFNATGILVGRITGAISPIETLLSHTIRFPRGHGFITEGDHATIIGPGPYDPSCSVAATETVSNIIVGTRFFKNVSSVDISADGYISFCPDLNENRFDLRGELCIE